MMSSYHADSEMDPCQHPTLNKTEYAERTEPATLNSRPTAISREDKHR